VGRCDTKLGPKKSPNPALPVALPAGVQSLNVEVESGASSAPTLNHETWPVKLRNHVLYKRRVKVGFRFKYGQRISIEDDGLNRTDN